MRVFNETELRTIQMLAEKEMERIESIEGKLGGTIVAFYDHLKFLINKCKVLEHDIKNMDKESQND